MPCSHLVWDQSSSPGVSRFHLLIVLRLTHSRSWDFECRNEPCQRRTTWTTASRPHILHSKSFWACVPKGKIIGASVGDCQAWIFDDGLPSIELTSGQHRKPLLGEGKATPVGFEGELGKRMLIVATDGLWKYAALSSIASTMRLRNSNPLLLDALADTLIDSARLPTGALQDDIAVAMVMKR